MKKEIFAPAGLGGGKRARHKNCRLELLYHSELKRHRALRPRSDGRDIRGLSSDRTT